MKSIFDSDLNRRSSDSIKWNYYDSDVLPLWVADMDFKVPEALNQAISERVSHSVYGYAKPQDSTILAIKNWLARRHNWIVAEEDILLAPGVVQAFNNTAKAYTNPGDSVIIQTPAYHPFFHVHNNNKLELIENQLSRDDQGRYFIDDQSLQDDIRPETRLFILCNPHNPSGRVFTKNELTHVAEVCLERNIIICSDEIHSDLVFDEYHHLPIASLSKEISDQTITLISASKTFNIAGLKSSAVIITNPDLRERFTETASGFLGSVNILGETAMAAAYTSCDDWLDELLVYLDGNRKLLTSFVQEELPGIDICPPEGTYLGWLDCTGTELENPGEFFLETARVGLNSGDWFGEEYMSFVRLNFACPRKVLIEALSRMKKGLTSR